MIFNRRRAITVTRTHAKYQGYRLKELQWLDMSLNAEKSTCIRIGPRFNVNCCNIVTTDGCELSWTNVVRYLEIFIESASCFKCSLDNAKRSFYRSFNGILEELVELP